MSEIDGKNSGRGCPIPVLQVERNERKLVRKPKYPLDWSALTSVLPWFEEAVEKRTVALIAAGQTEQDARDAALLRMTRLDEKTERGYASVWKEFVGVFCEERQLPCKPATAETGMAYVAWQARRGAVHKDSLTNYLSAINCAHKDLILPLPFPVDAQGKFLGDTLSGTLIGLGKAQGRRTRDAEDNDRLYLPPEIPLTFLGEAVQRLRVLDVSDQATVTEIRDDLAIAFAYADFGRSQSQAGLKVNDIVFEHTGALKFQFREAKNLTKNKHNLAFRWPVHSNPALLRGMKMWLSVRDRIGSLSTQFWQLPWDKKRLVGSDFDAMLQRSLKRRLITPGKGFVYSSHSSRAGAQSAAAAIGVTIVTIRRMGGYSPTSMVPEEKYIDPSCPPSPAALVFFGWLRPSPTT